MLAGVVVDFQAAETQAELVMRARGEGRGEAAANLPDALDVGHVRVGLDEVGKQLQPSRRQRRALPDLLLGHQVAARGVVVLGGRGTGKRHGPAGTVAVEVFEVTGVAPQAEPIGAGLPAQGWRPAEFGDRVVAGGARGATEIQALLALGETRIDLIKRGLQRPLCVQLVTRGGAPLADRPGEPVRRDIAGHGAAEAEVLERAGEGVYLAAHGQTAELDQQAVVQQCLLVIELHQPGDAAVAVDFLGLQQDAEVGLGVEVLAIAVDHAEAETGAGPAQQFVQVQRGVEHQLIGVGAGVVITALGIPGQLVDVGDLQIDAGLMQTGATAVPVAEEELIG